MPIGRPRNPARAKAKEQGARHYEGQPCEHGHTTRHVISGACVACQSEAQRQRRKARAAPELADMFA